MKRFLSHLALSALLALGIAFPASADTRVITLLNAVTATGASASMRTTMAVQSIDTWVFQTSGTFVATIFIEESLNGTDWFRPGTSFTTTNDWKTLVVCGGCQVRVNVSAYTSGNVTVLVTLTGPAQILTP